MSLKTTLSIFTPAKINLFLHVGDKLPSGYHSLKTVFQSIDLFDVLEITVSEPQSKQSQILISLDPNSSYFDLPLDKGNLIYKGAFSFLKAAKIKTDIHVKLLKKIPLAGGLAGGSSNCAGVIYALNHIFGEPLKHDELLELAKELGSDIPFCLSGGRMVGTGLGDRLLRLSMGQELIFVLLLPPPECRLNTKDVYARFDELSTRLYEPNVSFEKFVSFLLNDDVANISNNLYNSLEIPAISLSYWIEQAKSSIDSKGFHSLVSGSGATVFAALHDEQLAINLLEQLRMEGFNASIHRGIDIPHFQIISKQF